MIDSWLREGARNRSRPTKLKPSLRRWSKSDLLEAVRGLVMFGRFKDIIDPLFIPGPAHFRGRITAEEYSVLLRAKKPLIEQCFHKLNLEGLLTQGSNRPEHDSSRGWGGGSGWMATMYFRR